MTAYICKMKVLVTQLWLTLHDHMDCSSLVSSVLEILQARILNTGVDSHYLLQGIFSTQRLNVGLLH